MNNLSWRFRWTIYLLLLALERFAVANADPFELFQEIISTFCTLLAVESHHPLSEWVDDDCNGVNVIDFEGDKYDAIVSRLVATFSRKHNCLCRIDLCFKI